MADLVDYDLYVDINRGLTVQGIGNSSVVPLPKFILGDVLHFRVFLLKQTPDFPVGGPANPIYVIITNEELSLKVGFGPKDGEVAGEASEPDELYAASFTWNKSADNTYFYGTISLATAELANRIGDGETTGAWFEIEVTKNGEPTTVLQQSVTINGEVIETAALEPVPGQTVLTLEDAVSMFVGRLVEGQICLKNPTTGKIICLYVGDDNAFHADPQN